ncbi:MAG: translation elongation factor Ts, partial [Desulfovibrionales bacterium]|nr:translation elongation factor Ts [Desulfovibrionales bacterium]
YIHSNGKIAVLVELKCETDFVAKSDKFQELAKDLSMQVAATSPVCVSPDQLPQELLEKEKQIFLNQAKEEGKPENIAEKIVEGRIKKYYKEVCLLEQPFIKDDSKTITDLLNETVAVLGENIQIGRFTRMGLGEDA